MGDRACTGMAGMLVTSTSTDLTGDMIRQRSKIIRQRASLQCMFRSWPFVVERGMPAEG